jgi:hypothetical protein
MPSLIFVLMLCLLFHPLFFLSKNDTCSSSSTDEVIISDVESGLKSVFLSDFGYTLVGAKPVSIDLDLPEYMHNKTESKTALLNFLKSSFSNSSKFILRETVSFDRLELINIDSLLNQISTHMILSDFVCRKYGTDDRFFKQLRDSKLSIFEIMDFQSVLIGIILGYGEENGKFFIRRWAVGEYLQKYPIVAFFPFDQRPSPFWAFSRNTWYFKKPNLVSKPSLLPQFESLEKEWQWIKGASRGEFNRDPYPEVPYYISLPGYVSRYGPESDMIYKKFLKARDKLANLFCGRKFSEVVVEEAAKK